jgi:hypothetical protein
VRYDAKADRKAWKQVAKQEKRWAKDEAKFARTVERERFAPAERWVPPMTRRLDRSFYYAPVRYVPATVPAWGYASMDGRNYDNGSRYDALPLGYGSYDGSYSGWSQNGASTWPTNYGSPYAAAGTGLIGSQGNGLLGALLPIVLQSVLGGGDLGLGSLGRLGGLGGLTRLGSPDVLPLDQVGYAHPYSATGGDLSSTLLDSLF